MAYKISGEIDVNGVVTMIVVDESTWIAEYNGSKSNGAYEVTVSSGIKTVLVRTADGEVVGFGNITPYVV